ncbi:MAG: ABC-type Fe3+ transport system periplasmic component [Noviherbaspirillum sp.]|nr:ABC-type Fe3+ transport system periplasmic component [Noviherbaspirillum sp.]
MIFHRFTKRLRTWWLAATILAGVGALILPVHNTQAQDNDQEWKKVLEQANKEGRLLLGGPPVPIVRDFILKEFQKAYPAIQVELTAAVLPQFPARVEAERKAGKYLWDVYFWGPGPEVYRLANAGIFVPLKPALLLPDVVKEEVWGGWDNTFLDKGNKYLFSFWNELSTVQYNAAVIPPGTIKKLSDLLDPQYMGKIVWWDPRSGGSGSNYATLIYSRLGEEGFKRLFVDQKPLLVPNITDVADRIVRGTHPIALGSGVDALAPYKKAGMKLDIRELGRTADFAYAAVGYGTVAMFDKAPNENAAKVFVNWLLTRETQDALSKLTGRNSRRSDVPPVNEQQQPIRGEKYINPQAEEALDYKSKVVAASQRLRP